MKQKILTLLSVATVPIIFLLLVLQKNSLPSKVSYITINGKLDDNKMVASEGNENSEVSAVQKQSDFDVLMHSVLNPEARCKVYTVLGGEFVKGYKVVDGHKMICLEPARKLTEPCIVYSFGVNNEWSFEEAIQKKYDCQVYAFDPSMAVQDHLHSKDIWFYRMGISNNDKDKNFRYKRWKMNTFKAIKKKLGHQINQTIDVVKIDIEGSEFAVLENMLDTGMLNNVNHLCVEIHLNLFTEWKRVHRMLQRINEAGLHHFSTSNNTIGGPYKVPGEQNRTEHLVFEVAWFR